MVKNNTMCSYEIIQVPSGCQYKITYSDIRFFTVETMDILSKYIKANDIIAYFLPIGDMNFNQLIIYNACIELGAAIIRCTISDMDRQLPVIHSIRTDYSIAGKASLKYIYEKMKFDNHILFEAMDSLDNTEEQKQSVLRIYEFFDIPGFIIADKMNTIFCPGYQIMKICKKKFTICTRGGIQSFFVKENTVELEERYTCNMEVPQKMIRTKSFIKVQLKYLLKQKLNISVSENKISLDSFGMIELLVNIEEEFEIVIPISKIDAKNFQGMDSLTDLIFPLMAEGRE